MSFTENYYQLHEIFKIDKSGQQCFVVSHPIRKSDRHWSVMVRLIDDNYNSTLDVDACMPGDVTHLIGNAKPELHDCGFVKYLSKLYCSIKIPLITGKPIGQSVAS